MTTDQQQQQEKPSKADQARINGALSKGPTTADGKAKASKNALKHGFAATVNVVLKVEDETAFEAHRAGFIASFKPRDYVEETFVDQLASISWRQARLVASETAILDAQVSIQAHAIGEQFPDACNDPYFHLVKAIQAIAQNQRPESENDQQPPTGGQTIGSLELVRRYQTSLDRQFRNTMLNFRQYRKDFAETQPAPPPPESPEAKRTEQPKPTGTVPVAAVKPNEPTNGAGHPARIPVTTAKSPGSAGSQTKI